MMLEQNKIYDVMCHQFFSNQNRSNMVEKQCSKMRGDFALQQKVSARAGILAVAPYFSLYRTRCMFLIIPPSYPFSLSFFLPFPSRRQCGRSRKVSL